MTVARLTSDSSVLGLLQNDNLSPLHLIVSDTAAHIEGDFGALNTNATVNKIVVTDSGSSEIMLSAAMAVGDSAAIGELYASDGATAGSVAVSDIASVISTDFNVLNGDASVDRIIVTDSASLQVTLLAADAIADSRAEGELYQADGITAAQVVVSDVASAISSNLDALNADLHVGAITLQDPSDALALFAAQVAGDTRALDAITPSYTIAVADSSADVAQYLNALDDNTSIGSIAVTDAGPIDVSVATFGRDQTAIAIMTRGVDGPQALVTVSDSTANVALDLVNLKDSIAEIAGINLTDSGTLHISSIAALAADAPVIAEITSNYTLAVSDSGGDITSVGLDALEAYAVAGHLQSLSVDGGGDIAITVAEIASDQDALALTANGDASPYTLAVTDTASHVGASPERACAEQPHRCDRAEQSGERDDDHGRAIYRRRRVVRRVHHRLSFQRHRGGGGGCGCCVGRRPCDEPDGVGHRRGCGGEPRRPGGHRRFNQQCRLDRRERADD